MNYAALFLVIRVVKNSPKYKDVSDESAIRLMYEMTIHHWNINIQQYNCIIELSQKLES